MDETENELVALTATLAKQDARRANVMYSRDEVIRRALSEGKTWTRITELTGLAPRGIALAKKRQRPAG